MTGVILSAVRALNYQRPWTWAACRAAWVCMSGLVFLGLPILILHPAAPSGLFAFLAFLPVFSLCTIPMTFLELRLTRRWSLPALAPIAVGIWLAFYACVVAARFEAVYVVELASSWNPSSGVARLGNEIAWIQGAGPPDFVTPRAFGPMTLAPFYFARVPAFVVPPFTVAVFLRLAWPRLRFFALPVAALLLPVMVGVHSVIADRFPPFTYKCPGWNGYREVLHACELGIVPGLLIVPVLYAVCSPGAGGSDG